MHCFNISSGVLRKKNPPNKEYKNYVFIAIFVGMSFGVECFGFKCHFLPASSLHLWDRCPIAVTSILEYHLE